VKRSTVRNLVVAALAVAALLAYVLCGWLLPYIYV